MIPSANAGLTAADQRSNGPAAAASRIWNIGATPQTPPSAAAICNPHRYVPDDVAFETLADPPAATCRRYAPYSDTNYSKAFEDCQSSHSRLKQCHSPPPNSTPKPAVLAPWGPETANLPRSHSISFPPKFPPIPPQNYPPKPAVLAPWDQPFLFVA